jgi:hypothetical protein
VIKERTKGATETCYVRLDQVRQAIKNSIIGHHSLFSPFSKFQKINSRKGDTVEGLGDE